MNFDLQPGWLRRHEENVWSSPVRRSFLVEVGGERLRMTVERLAQTSADAFAYAPPRLPELPTDAEILLLIARAFLGSLPVHPQAEPDLEKGWDAFRQQALETTSSRYCPKWRDLNAEWREAFAAGVRKAMEGGAR